MFGKSSLNSHDLYQKIYIRGVNGDGCTGQLVLQHVLPRYVVSVQSNEDINSGQGRVMEIKYGQIRLH